MLNNWHSVLLRLICSDQVFSSILHALPERSRNKLREDFRYNSGETGLITVCHTAFV